MKNLPDFESPFLSDIAKSFSKIRKGLNYDSHELKFNKVMDLVGDRKSEKVEISIHSSASRNSIRTRLYIWDDRWLWLDARKSEQKGWAWEYSVEGRLSGSATEKELMEALKSFYKNSLSYNEENIGSQANAFWNELIAMGPKAVTGCGKGPKKL